MSEENTQNLDGGRSFEERVFARFDIVDARFDAVDSRLQVLETRADDTNSRLEKLEVRAYDTKPIWEQALKEIVDTRREIVDTRREVSKRLDRIEAVVYETRSDLRDLEDRIEKLESKPI